MRPEKRTVMVRHVPWKWVGLGAVVIVLVVAGKLLPVTRWLMEFDRWIAGMGGAGIVFFAAAYAAAAVLFVPGSILTLGAGFIFGILWGTVAVSLGSTTGAGLAFLIARYIARDKVLSLARKNARFAAIDQAIGRQGWKIVLLLRLSPLVPFNASNYLYGLTGVRFWPYVLASWIGMLPATVLYVYLGATGRAGVQVAAGQGAPHSTLHTSLLVTGLVATAVVTWYVSRTARKALQGTRINAGTE
jgi:uncharacterized membrane protein YdjX (TVP38/TMEM64 family)